METENQERLNLFLNGGHFHPLHSIAGFRTDDAKNGPVRAALGSWILLRAGASDNESRGKIPVAVAAEQASRRCLPASDCGR